MKLIVLLLGIAIGAAGGLWLGVNHPELAKNLDAQRERWMLEGKLAATKAIKEKLGSASTDTSAPAGARGFVGGIGGSGSGTSNAAQVVADQEREIEQQLQAAKSK